MRPRAPVLHLVVLAGIALAACNEQATSPRSAPTAETIPGDVRPRTFAMGLSSLPSQLTDESYERTFELAASVGEVILIQRTPPWQEMLSGDLSDETVQATRREIELAERFGLDLFVAIDPTDPAESRGELAGLPPELRGAGFGDERVREAFIAYARYVAENYQPKYLALGVEINGYQRQHPEDFERFVLLYHEAYQAVKELAPDTLVFPTFQLEELQGLLPPGDPYPPQWYLINRFVPRLDLLAVSSYPHLAFETFDEIPSAYFAQLATYTDRPIVISGLGYPGDASDGGEEEQAAFLRRALDNAQQLQMPLVVWFAGQDLSFVGGAPFERLQHIGLRDQQGIAKQAWRVWEAAARRPLAAAGP